MSTRPARTAHSAVTAASNAGAAAAQPSKAMPTRTATRGLTDITNRVAEGHHQRRQPATRTGKEAVAAATDKKPRATTTVKATTRSTTNVTRTTSTRRTTSTTNGAAPTTSTSAAPPVARATVRQRTTTSTARNASATQAPSLSAASAATTTSAESSRPRSVKRVASRAELVAAKKPRLDSDPDTSAVALHELNAPVAPPKDAGWVDLDQADWNDPVMVVEYADEVFAYMKELEVKTMPSDSLLKQQREIAWSHRSTLVDWLISIHFKFRLLPETLFLAINILDRTLSTGPVSLGNFQLLGTASMFIAAKYEEVMCPSIEYFGMCGGDTFNEDDLRACERQVLRKLEFDISYPNPMNFLRRISKADDYDVETRTLAKYLLEIGLVDWRLLAHPPSALAAAAFWLARRMLNRGEWGPTLVHYSTYAESELLATAEIMLDYILRQPSAEETHATLDPNGQGPGTAPSERHPKFFKKYSAKRFFAVATYVRAWAANNYPHSVILGRGEPEADEPIAVDLFGERGYDRPNAAHLMHIFNLNPTVIDLTEDDGGLAPMPFSPQRAQTSPSHHLTPMASSTGGGEPMPTTPSTTNGIVRDDDAEMVTASFIEPNPEFMVGEVSDVL